MKDVKISDYLWFQEGPGVRNTQYTTSGVKLINLNENDTVASIAKVRDTEKENEAEVGEV